MSFFPKKDYNFIQFQKSNKADKKYTAVLQKKTKTKDGVIKYIHFGGVKPNGYPYDQYEDKVLGLYSEYNHKDKKRRSAYRKRHSSDINKPYSASWFSLKYLW